jgi:polyribonucleotide 5'-hydroxyl-kinase
LDDAYRARIRAQQIKSYFYGEPALPSPLTGLPGRTTALETGLHPYSFTIPWDELEIYRVGEGEQSTLTVNFNPCHAILRLRWSHVESAAPSSALPIGKQRVLSATRLTRVNPASSPSIHRLQNAVLSLVMVTENDKRTDLPPRKVKEVQPDEVKTEGVKQEGDVATQNSAVKPEDDDEEEEEEPIWREEIGWREVCGFLTM